MRQLLVIAIFIFASCEAPPFAKDTSETLPRMKRITFPCNDYNGTVEWVTCTPVTLDLSTYPGLVSAEMTYVMATTRGSSYLIAELYDLTHEQSIPLSDVKSKVGPTVYSKPTSANILDFLPKEEVDLVIRFRASNEGAVGSINDFSYLTLTYQ